MDHDSSNFLAALDSKGNFRFVFKQSDGQVSHGNFVQILIDGTTVFSNHDGKILKVVHYSGSVHEYFYHEHGQLNEILFPDGSVWNLAPAGSWQILDQDRRIAGALNLFPSVDQDGILWVKDRNGHSRPHVND